MCNVIRDCYIRHPLPTPISEAVFLGLLEALAAMVT